jgi:hypothetical protein
VRDGEPEKPDVAPLPAPCVERERNQPEGHEPGDAPLRHHVPADDAGLREPVEVVVGVRERDEPQGADGSASRGIGSCRPVTGTSVFDAWQAERAHLGELLLLPEPLRLGRDSTRDGVTEDCLVSFEGERYSEPFRLPKAGRGSHGKDFSVEHVSRAALGGLTSG